MLSHLPDLLWLPSLVMTLERDQRGASAQAASPWRDAGSWENLRVIDLPPLPPWTDPVSRGDMQKDAVLVL